MMQLEIKNFNNINLNLNLNFLNKLIHFITNLHHNLKLLLLTHKNLIYNNLYLKSILLYYNINNQIKE